MQYAISAGLALLQRHSESPKSHDEMVEAPREKIREAFAFHQFAEAAYPVLLFNFLICLKYCFFFPPNFERITRVNFVKLLYFSGPVA